MNENIKVSSGKGFKFITNFVIHETSHQKIKLDFKYIPKPDGSLHHTRLEIIKLSKKPSESWEVAKTNKIILTTKEPDKSLNKLIDAIKAQKDLYKKSQGEAVILSTKESNFFKQIGDENIDFITQVLQSFQSKEAKEALLDINNEEMVNLFTTIKHAKNKQAVNQLEKLIDQEVVEQKFQEWIEKNTWIFGTEYIKKIDTRRIGIHSNSDFIVESLDGFTDLIELKRSNVKLFDHDQSRNCYYPSRDLSQVIGQAIHYIKVMEDHRLILKEEDEIDVLKPRVKVVIGRSNNLNENERKSLRLLNASLHGVEIITFDEILTRAEKIISIYE